MSLQYRKRIPLGRLFGLNLSGRGASLSARVGRVTVSSRGRVNVRLGKGLSWRIR